MNKRPTKGKVIGSTSSANGGWRHTTRARAQAQGRALASTTATRSHLSSGVFIGPSVDGVDKEYVKVISGKVTTRKPSFA